MSREVIDRIGDAEIVFTNKTPMPREVFDTCTNIRYVGVLATGYNVVDVDAAKEKNIPVCNIPTYGTAAWDSSLLHCCWRSAITLGIMTKRP